MGSCVFVNIFEILIKHVQNMIFLELMIDVTTGHEALSFMDYTTAYNQIYMALEDQGATGFRTPKGIVCYKVMMRCKRTTCDAKDLQRYDA